MVQKPLYPEGADICHAILVHAPGGIAGGDTLALDVAVAERAHALLTTPSATKWYKSAGRPARQRVSIAAEDGAILEWLPQEAILFDQTDAESQVEVALSGAAAYAGWEILCFGRRASGERFDRGRLRQRLRLRRNGALLWNESLVLAGGDRLLRSPIGLRGRHVQGGMIVAAGVPQASLLEACRAIEAEDGEGGVTVCGEVLSARYLGDSAEAARDYFEALRGVLRPWYAGRSAERPRIWRV